MIDPAIRMHGFDSPSFQRLGALAAGRGGGRPELHVLHEDGRVVAAVHTVDGPVRLATSRLDDPPADAARLRAEHGVDRVVLCDADALSAALAATEAAVTPAWSQPDVMLAAQEAFRACPGVVCDPPLPGLDGWRGLRRALADVGAGAWVLAAADRDGWPIALAGRLERGRIVEATDLAPAAVAVLPDLDRVADVLGAPVVAALVTTTADLEATLSAADVATRLLDRMTLRSTP